MKPNDSKKYDELKCLQELATGNEKALSSIFENYRDRVFRNAFYYTRNYHTAEDILQEVFIKVWDKRQRIGLIENFSSYLVVLTRNMCINVLIKRKRMKEQLGEFAEEVWGASNYSTDEILVVKEYNSILHRAIRKLPAKQKQVYTLSEEGIKYNDIARVLNISFNTVRNHRIGALNTIRMEVNNKLHLGYNRSNTEEAA